VVVAVVAVAAVMVPLVAQVVAVAAGTVIRARQVLQAKVPMEGMVKVIAVTFAAAAGVVLAQTVPAGLPVVMVALVWLLR